MRYLRCWLAKAVSTFKGLLLKRVVWHSDYCLMTIWSAYCKFIYYNLYFHLPVSWSHHGFSLIFISDLGLVKVSLTCALFSDCICERSFLSCLLSPYLHQCFWIYILVYSSGIKAICACRFFYAFYPLSLFQEVLCKLWPRVFSLVV